jgi:hypothetical protein
MLRPIAKDDTIARPNALYHWYRVRCVFGEEILNVIPADGEVAVWIAALKWDSFLYVVPVDKSPEALEVHKMIAVQPHLAIVVADQSTAADALVELIDVSHLGLGMLGIIGTSVLCRNHGQPGLLLLLTVRT